MTAATKSRANQASSDEQTLEDRIDKRLREVQAKYAREFEQWEAYRSLTKAERKRVPRPPEVPRQPDLEADIYQLLYRELRSAAAMAGFNWRANNPNVDVSCRYTSALNTAFAHILDRYPDKLLAVTRQQLGGYVARAMSNMMLNHLKRKSVLRTKIERFLGMTEAEQLETSAVLAAYTREKAERFEDSVGIAFEAGLTQIETWEQSGDEKQREMAEAVRLRYAYGLAKDEVAERMGLSRDDFDALLERAKYHLRKAK